MYKAILCYEHRQSMSKNKDCNRSIKRSYSKQRKKGYKPSIHRNQHSRFPGNKKIQNNKFADKSEYQSNILAESGTKPIYFVGNKTGVQGKYTILNVKGPIIS